MSDLERRLHHAARELRSIDIEPPPLATIAPSRASARRPSGLAARVPALVMPVLFVLGGLAVIGGALGNQVGGGNGRKLATVAGAVAGGYAGRRIDQRHVGGQVVANTRTECHTVSDSSQSSRVVAWNVTYRNPDGTTGSMRTGEQPGEQIRLGEGEEVVGYDVTYRHEDVERTVRMDEDPGNRLPILDGKVVLQTAALDDAPDRG